METFMALADDMRRLRSRIAEDRRRHSEELAHIRAATAQRMTELATEDRAARRADVAALHQAGAEGRNDRVAYLNELRRDTAIFLQEFAAEQQVITAANEEDRRAYVSDLRHRVAALFDDLQHDDVQRRAAIEQLRDDVAMQLANYHIEHGALRRDYVADLRRDVADLLAEYDADLKARAAVERTTRHAYVDRLRHDAAQGRSDRENYLNELRRDTTTYLQDVALIQQITGAEHRRQRRDYVAQLRSDVAELLTKYDYEATVGAVEAPPVNGAPSRQAPPAPRQSPVLPPPAPQPALERAVGAPPVRNGAAQQKPTSSPVAPSSRATPPPTRTTPAQAPQSAAPPPIVAAPPAPAQKPQEKPAAREGMPERANLNQTGVYAYAKRVRVAMMKELDEAQQTLTAKQRQQINTYVEGLRRNILPFLKTVSAVSQTLNDEQRRQLSTYMDGLRRNVAALVTELDTVSYMMTDEQRATMGDYVDTLSQDVQGLLNELSLACQSLTAPQPASARPTPDAPVQGSQAQTIAPVMTSLARNDLTAIPGLGSDVEQRLNKAGILTYAHLAQSTPQALRAALSDPHQRVSLDERVAQARAMARWIAQARVLARSN
jgi:predicted flap endonuclease-1-like 5' DNA nuclease